MEDENDVPPLEDMSDLLSQVSAIKESRTSVKSATESPDAQHNQKIGDSHIEPHRSNDKVDLGLKNQTPVKQTDQVTKQEKRSDKASFGGMKKGFLFGGTSKSKGDPKTTANKTSRNQQDLEDAPIIKPQVSKEDQYRLPEVQNAMSAGQALVNNKEWITEDLLSNVSKNETLLKRMTDPRFMQAMQEFQTNPTAAMEKYKDNKEVQQFLQEFCGLMGEHFNKLADTQEGAGSMPQTATKPISTRASDTGAEMTVRSSTNPKQATAADEAKMQEILSNPEIREVLLDPRIQKIIETLRTDPDKAQKALQLADTELRRKINKLVDCGLLQFQT